MGIAEQTALNRTCFMEEGLDNRLESMIHDHARFVYRVAYSVLRNHHDAEDAAQETFLRAARHEESLAELRDPRAWLARIAWRVALDRTRARRTIPLEAAAGEVSRLRAAGASAEELAGGSQMQALLEGLIAQLPRRFREVLVLSTIEELSTAQIAGILGIREVSVRAALHRARQMLREKLAQAVRGRP